MTTTIYQIDAFTDELFGGNPAGVVINADHLNEAQMQSIAKEMNLSETAFVLNSSVADFKLRYLTPTSEVKFCGHATVGSLHSLALENLYELYQGEKRELKVETGAGIIKMSVDYKDKRDILIQFDSPNIDLEETNYSHTEIADAMKINVNLIDQTQPIYREKTNDFIYITTKDLDSLGKIKYDYNHFKKFTDKENITVISFVTNDTFDQSNHFHNRVFGPSIGLVEDPVTGAIQGGLASYMHKTGQLETIPNIIGSEQGNFVGRPGFLKIKLKEENGNYKATIIAQAVKVFKTEINI